MKIPNKAIHIAPDVRADGTREVIGLWIEQNEGVKFRLRVMNELRNRGVEDILLATDADTAEKALTAFQAGPWGSRYPAIGRCEQR